MYYYDKEKATAAVQAEITNYKKCIAIIEEIKEVVKDFDGKVINKRLQTAIQKKTGLYVYVTIAYDKIEITLRGGYYPGVDREKQPTRGLNDEYYLVNCAYLGGALDKVVYNIDKSKFREVTTLTESGNHRLNAKNMIITLDERRADFEERIKENKEALKQIDKYLAKYEQMLTLEKEINSLPLPCKKYFDIAGYYKHY